MYRKCRMWRLIACLSLIHKHWTLLCLASTDFQQPATCINCSMSIENMNIHNITKEVKISVKWHLADKLLTWMFVTIAAHRTSTVVSRNEEWNSTCYQLDPPYEKGFWWRAQTIWSHYHPFQWHVWSSCIEHTHALSVRGHHLNLINIW